MEFVSILKTEDNNIAVKFYEHYPNLNDHNVLKIVKFKNPNLITKLEKLTQHKTYDVNEIIRKIDAIISREDLIYNNKNDVPYLIQINDISKKYFFCNRMYKTLDFIYEKSNF
jgi:hypothetical protein